VGVDLDEDPIFVPNDVDVASHPAIHSPQGGQVAVMADIGVVAGALDDHQITPRRLTDLDRTDVGPAFVGSGRVVIGGVENGIVQERLHGPPRGKREIGVRASPAQQR
jgi:hypothetical protein